MNKRGFKRKGWRRRKRVAPEKGGFLLPFSRDDDNATTTTTRGDSFGGTGDDEHQSPILAREKATPHSSTGWCCVFEDAPRSPATVNAIRARVRSFLRSSSRTNVFEWLQRCRVHVQTVRLCKTCSRLGILLTVYSYDVDLFVRAYDSLEEFGGALDVS